jgi:integrase
VDFEQNVVHVLGKMNIYRKIPLSDHFREILLDAKAKATSDFIIEYKGGPINKLRRSVDTACKKAGISYKVTMYDIRHLFATTALSEGADLKAVSAVLGHSSTKMTADIYYHLLHGEKKRAVDLIPSISGEEKRAANVLTFEKTKKRLGSGSNGS